MASATCTAVTKAGAKSSRTKWSEEGTRGENQSPFHSADVDVSRFTVRLYGPFGDRDYLRQLQACARNRRNGRHQGLRRTPDVIPRYLGCKSDCPSGAGGPESV